MGTTETDTAATVYKWVVGIDGSPDATAALRWAARFATERGETLIPLAAWHRPLAIAAMSGGRDRDNDRESMRSEAARAADETIAAVVASNRQSAPDVVAAEPVATEVVEGHPTPLLLERSAPDTVVVVGRRGISALKRRLLGSVSQALATGAAGPVVVVPAGWDDRPCRRIVVGFDGSDHAGEALRWALAIAPVGCDVIALIAIDVAPWLSAERVIELHGDLVTETEQKITDAADLIDPFHRAERKVLLHGPRQAFADELSIADLVVIGPRGAGLVARTVLGSLTTWLLSDSPCPVAVVTTSAETHTS